MPQARRMFVIWSALLTVAACGGSSSPTQPSPPPAAAITATGTSQWSLCLPLINTCTWQAEIKNTGIGCAANVRGTVTFRTAQGVIEGSYNWTGPSLMRPGETYVYTVPNVPAAIASSSGGTYQTQPSFDTVRCP